ncbi:sulfur oxidation c-type cytochrome SoxX [Dichotomicrobium thermohalophilum]|uniref:Monoheme cytochrome SoxX (Sulfur oxidation) n=1 Tax=Dichotomicrobium thermohalophilum TaxID=933063 RepID=A0A397Q4N0_9HYPH|nr:sulfur oxidation c-type cytochrome SoxX [Dichotomicrobium thermohalophilum]RIA56062.1 monoheme cytochrome SoxX (sulfur oxidation) [Dichotomicrobium thermohalophilum]
MYPKIPHKSGLIALVATALLVFAGGYAVADSHKKKGAEKVDYTAMSSEELAEYLIFEAEGFDVDEKTQEGRTVRDRLTQDELQKTCSKLKGGPVDGDTAQKVMELARDSMVYPEGGIELGDWKRGQAVAENAFGFRVGHKVDDHSARETGGLCINCHQFEEEKVDRSGTLGPSLIGYGKMRGTNEQMLKYTYEVIYNAHVVFPCTKMPRFGANGVLSQEKIADVMAYLMDPESPVNE